MIDLFFLCSRHGNGSNLRHDEASGDDDLRGHGGRRAAGAQVEGNWNNDDLLEFVDFEYVTRVARVNLAQHVERRQRAGDAQERDRQRVDRDDRGQRELAHRGAQ